VSKTWLVVSTGQQVAVAGPEALATWWAALAPQIPGTSRGPLAEAAGTAALVLPDGITARDTRLQINAHLHGEPPGPRGGPSAWGNSVVRGVARSRACCH
jgi:hypothetical protein